MGKQKGCGVVRSTAEIPRMWVSSARRKTSRIHPGDCQHLQKQQEKSIGIHGEGTGAMQATCHADLAAEQGDSIYASVNAAHNAVTVACVFVRCPHERAAGTDVPL